MSEDKKVYANAAEEIAAIDLSIKRAQLEDIKLQQRERELNLEDLKGRLADRETKAKQKELDRKQQGITFAQQRASDEAKQAACTHKKGGTVSQRNMQVLSTGGNSIQYAVIKHQMINGDMWVRCLRCGKTWLPPVRENFVFNAKGKKVAPKDGTFNAEKFAAAEQEYIRAVQFETNNSPSGSVQCRFSKWDADSEQWVDASKDYRTAVRNTTLR
jgi:hypothetical protein